MTTDRVLTESRNASLTVDLSVEGTHYTVKPNFIFRRLRSNRKHIPVKYGYKMYEDNIILLLLLCFIHGNKCVAQNWYLYRYTLLWYTYFKMLLF